MPCSQVSTHSRMSESLPGVSSASDVVIQDLLQLQVPLRCRFLSFGLRLERPPGATAPTTEIDSCVLQRKKEIDPQM